VELQKNKFSEWNVGSGSIKLFLNINFFICIFSSEPDFAYCDLGNKFYSEL
jgi:hypothetical protein